MDAERSLRYPSKSPFRAGSQRRSALPRLDWLLVAVGLCWLAWPAPAGAQPACQHDICEIGGQLNPVCDPCVDTICNDPVYGEESCCAADWDQSCIDLVLGLCEDPTCAQICDHNPCDVGGPLDSTCNSCTALVCFLDPGCCTDDGDPSTDDWDASCVAKVTQECGYQCEPGENICSNATPITTGKIFGTLLGANNDGCESGHNSCSAADVWYSYTQPIDQDMLLSTCATQRSFAIDTVVSVHEGCPGKANNEIASNDDHVINEGGGNAPAACILDPTPTNVDAGVALEGALSIAAGETVVIRVAHHASSLRNPFELRFLPEPGAWLALVAGAGALGALSRRRARG